MTLITLVALFDRAPTQHPRSHTHQGTTSLKAGGNYAERIDGFRLRVPRVILSVSFDPTALSSSSEKMRSSVFALAAFAAIETQAQTFQSCEVPSFEWAAYGNRVTGRMYGMTAAVNDNHIFAGGFLKSTLDPEAADFVESTADYAVTGPYTSSDWNGTNAKTITVDLQLARTRRYSSSTVRLAATYWPDRWLAP